MAIPGALGRAIVTGGLAAVLSAAAIGEPLDCERLAVSVLPEPPGYAAQCLGLRTAPPPAEAPRLPDGAVGTAYYLNLRSGGSTGQRILTAPLATLSYVIGASQTAPIFAWDYDSTLTSLWGIDNTTRNLGTISLPSGVFNPVVAVTGIPDDTISGMSFDPTTPTLFVCATNGNPPTISKLYTLNTSTGVATLVGPVTGYPALVDIAVGIDGRIFGHDVGGDRLIEIHRATGAGTEIGATGLDANFAQGMDFEASTNTLWAPLYLGGGQTRLVTFSLTTGTATVHASSANEELEMSILDFVQPTAAVPVELVVDPGGDTVLDAGETVTAAPSWWNVGGGPLFNPLGAIGSFTGPGGPAYSITDANAAYPTFGSGAIGTCSDCYGISVTGARPAPHWDASLIEDLPAASASNVWNIHIGGSFADVPSSSPFYRFVERLFHRGITAGCGPAAYCPGNPVTREEMAVFVLVSKYPGLNPPACAPPNAFNDVPETSPFCRFIEDLASRSVVAGCGSGNYCPTFPVTRAEMAVFLLRTRFGQDFTPPACGTPLFSDVPASDPFCRWIEELSRRGITAGCGPGTYCPNSPVTREQMAVFLNQAFFPPLTTPTPGPTPPGISGGLTRSGSGIPPSGADPIGIGLLFIGFAAAIGLPLAVRASRRRPDEPIHF